MKITKFEYQKKDPNRVNIYVDDKFIAGIDVNDLIRLGLYNNQELSRQELNRILGESEFGKLFNSALNFLSFRPRSEWEVRHKLKLQLAKKKPANPSLIDNVVAKLKKINQVNDESFIRWYIDQRQTFRPMGERGIKSELLKKGIDRKLIDKVTAGKGSKDKLSEDALAQKAAAKFIKRLRPGDYDRSVVEKTKAKLQRLLAARGFDWETIRGTVEKLLPKGYNIDG